MPPSSRDTARRMSPASTCEFDWPFVSVMFVCFMAWICFDIAAFSCTTFRGADVEGKPFFYGLWKRQGIDGNCESYRDVAISLKFGRMFGLVGCLFGFAIMVFVGSTRCAGYRKLVSYTTSLVMTVLSALLMVGLRTPFCSGSNVAHDCQFNTTGVTIILALIFWFIVGLCSNFLDEQEPPPQNIARVCPPRTSFPVTVMSGAADFPNEHSDNDSSMRATQRIECANLPTGTTQTSFGPLHATSRPMGQPSSARNCVRIETFHHPDGSVTKRTTKTSTQPDGSTAVEESVEITERMIQSSAEPQASAAEPSQTSCVIETVCMLDGSITKTTTSTSKHADGTLVVQRTIEILERTIQNRADFLASAAEHRDIETVHLPDGSQVKTVTKTSVQQGGGNLAVVERTILITQPEVKSAGPSSPIPEPQAASNVSHREPSRISVADQRSRTIRYDDDAKGADGVSLPELQEEEVNDEIKGEEASNDQWEVIVEDASDEEWDRV